MFDHRNYMNQLQQRFSSEFYKKHMYGILDFYFALEDDIIENFVQCVSTFGDTVLNAYILNFAVENLFVNRYSKNLQNRACDIKDILSLDVFCKSFCAMPKYSRLSENVMEYDKEFFTLILPHYQSSKNREHFVRNINKITGGDSAVRCFYSKEQWTEILKLSEEVVEEKDLERLDTACQLLQSESLPHHLTFFFENSHIYDKDFLYDVFSFKVMAIHPLLDEEKLGILMKDLKKKGKENRLDITFFLSKFRQESENKVSVEEQWNFYQNIKEMTTFKEIVDCYHNIRKN